MAQLRRLAIPASSSVPIALSDGSDFFLESLAKLKLHDSNLKNGMVIGNIPQTITVTSRLIRLVNSLDAKTSVISPMALRRTVSQSLDQLRDLWNLNLLYINSMPQLQQDVGAFILQFFHTLQAIETRIVSLRPKTSLVQKYCLQWTVCVEDCMRMLGADNAYFPQWLLTSIAELILVSALEIPQIISAVEEQLGPVSRCEDSSKLLGPHASSAHQVKNHLTFLVSHLTNLLEVRHCRLAS